VDNSLEGFFMGFWESMRQGLESMKQGQEEGYMKESERLGKARERSSYQTVKERKEEEEYKFLRHESGVLMRKYKDPSTSKDDKRRIAETLNGRGYVLKQNGVWDIDDD
jgi:hypothetical protein